MSGAGAFDVYMPRGASTTADVLGHENDSALCGVGAKRVALGCGPGSPRAKHVCPSRPSPNPLCKFPSDGLSREIDFRLAMLPSPASSPPLFFPFRFPASHGIHRAVENNSVQRMSLSWRPSPCTELSSAPSTMTPPTLSTNITGLLGLSFPGEPPTFTRMNSNEIV